MMGESSPIVGGKGDDNIDGHGKTIIGMSNKTCLPDDFIATTDKQSQSSSKLAPSKLAPSKLAPSIPDGQLLDSLLEESALSDPSISMAISMMLRARDYAFDCNRVVWDFAVEISDLKSAGVSTDEIRWLVGKQLAEHAEEIPVANPEGRTFDYQTGFSFSPRSCFILSELGLQLARALPALSSNDNSATTDTVVETEIPEDQELPRWDSDRHELRIGNVVVKRFKWRATNQEAILNAFQEENWPPRIDDPLPPKPEKDPKRRLSDTIKCLNRKQDNALIRFRGDGTGEGVLWFHSDES